MRGLLAEFGIIFNQGISAVRCIKESLIESINSGNTKFPSRGISFLHSHSMVKQLTKKLGTWLSPERRRTNCRHFSRSKLEWLFPYSELRGK